MHRRNMIAKNTFTNFKSHVESRKAIALSATDPSGVFISSIRAKSVHCEDHGMSLFVVVQEREIQIEGKQASRNHTIVNACLLAFVFFFSLSHHVYGVIQVECSHWMHVAPAGRDDQLKAS